MKIIIQKLFINKKKLLYLKKSESKIKKAKLNNKKNVEKN